MTDYQHLTITYTHQERVAVVTLRRPEVRNAFNTQTMQELVNAFQVLGANMHLHAVVLTGEGTVFCAGADVNMMQQSVSYTKEQNLEEALYLSDLMHTINTLPCPLIGRVNGAALGGGVGLIAVCDIVIAVESARFALSEVKLGIAPAAISPYVIRKIGETHARALFMTGERFGAERARQIGLVHTIVPVDELDEMLEKTIQELLTSAPEAARVCKALAMSIGTMSHEEARSFTATTIATLRTSAEGQEGLRAFLEKRKPNWVKTSPNT
ncbi:enoyl-CoA hydratase-related protein [Ktedonospora formicarum]|uniref:Enoyl-CoA hydratase n=1 Tax=Ktedonospora formicarum TaxID=2778364 RepID=A0A8J3HVD0_9CHLR|nr:enoyl-CoA hydratase-related protein [Ktedonospora formicarum]GHO42661.1 enoyl-CoA hydratase [Ktedonospora formicarum]